MTVRVPAKVNLHLAVGPLRADGFHDVTSLYHAVSLYDEVTVAPAGELTVTVAGEGAGALPTDDRNLAVRAARALAEAVGVEPAVRIELRRGIPVAGGLAGGSADAAATLVGCAALWRSLDQPALDEAALDEAALLELASGLGSDVPFALVGGTALGAGRGDRLTPVLASGRWHWALAVATDGLSTPQVYAELDRRRANGEVLSPAGGPEPIINALRSGEPAALGRTLANELEPAALSLRPSLRRTLRAGTELGALGALVSGSGPTCAFLARSADDAVRLAAALTSEDVCRTVRTAYGPVPGARVIEPPG